MNNRKAVRYSYIALYLPHVGLTQFFLCLSFAVDPHNVDFLVRIETMPDKGKYAVLLFVNTVPSLSMDFFIVDRNNPKSFTCNRLHREGI